MPHQELRDSTGRLIGHIDMASDGTQTLRNHYGDALGSYNSKSNKTRHRDGRLFGQGNQLTGLLHATIAKQDAQSSETRKPNRDDNSTGLLVLVFMLALIAAAVLLALLPGILATAFLREFVNASWSPPQMWLGAALASAALFGILFAAGNNAKKAAGCYVALCLVAGIAVYLNQRNSDAALNRWVAYFLEARPSAEREQAANRAPVPRDPPKSERAFRPDVSSASIQEVESTATQDSEVAVPSELVDDASDERKAGSGPFPVEATLVDRRGKVVLQSRSSVFSKNVSILPPGLRVRAEASSGKWIKIQTDQGLEGYVRGNQLQIEPQSHGTEVPE